MKSVLIAAVFSTIMVSSTLAAQKPDTGRTKDGTPVIHLPNVRPEPVVTKGRAAPVKPKVDTNAVKVFRGVEVDSIKFAKDSAARADTFAIRRAAVADSGESAVVERIVADTAWVLVADRRETFDIPGSNGTTAGTAIAAKKLRVERRNGKWVQVSLKP